MLPRFGARLLAEVEEAAAELQTALEVIGRDVEVRPVVQRSTTVFGGARRAEAEDIVGGADIELRAGKLASHAVTLITLRWCPKGVVLLDGLVLLDERIEAVVLREPER